MFDRIRRITGYLTGSLNNWNDAKLAEERDRKKHEAAKESDDYGNRIAKKILKRFEQPIIYDQLELQTMKDKQNENASSTGEEDEN